MSACASICRAPGISLRLRSFYTLETDRHRIHLAAGLLDEVGDGHDGRDGHDGHHGHDVLI